MEWFIISRDMHVLCNPSTESLDSLPIDDSGSRMGQEIAIVNNVATGTYDFTTDPRHPDSVYVTEGNYIAFCDKYGKHRLYTIMTVDGEDELDAHCEDIGLDLINEDAETWDTTGSPEPVADTLERVLKDTGWTIGTNEIKSRTRATKYEGFTDSQLTRVGSIMTAFDAECDFEIELKGSKVVKQAVNIYRTLGQDKTQQRFVDDVNLISLRRSGSIEDLCTCMRCYGKEDAETKKRTTIADIEYDDGRYYSPAGHIRIYDREARNKWSRFRAYSYEGQGEFDGYINGTFEYDTDDPQELFNRGLSELQSRNEKKVAYEASLYDLKADIGDTIQIADSSKQEKVYLSARIQSVRNHYTVKGQDTGVLANYKMLESSPTSDVAQMMEELKKMVVSVSGSKVAYQVSSSGTDIPTGDWVENPPATNAGEYLWTRTITTYSDGSSTTAYSVSRNGNDGDSPTVTVNEDSSLTITDKTGEQTTAPLKGEDGKTSYTHTKYSNDGGKSFTGNLVPTDFTKWASGYYGKNGMTENEKRICYGEMIPVTPSGSYKLKTNYADDTITLGLTQYAEDGSYIDVRYAKTAKYTMRVLDTCCFVRPYIRADDAEGFNYEAFAAAFKNGEIIPEIYVNDGSAGNGTGSYMGVLTDFNEEASLTTNDYTWNKIKGDPVGVTESDTEPEEPYEGMLWKNTGTIEGKITGATYKRNGAEWELYLFVAENIQAESLSAICAYLGEVHSGKIINEVENADGNNVKALEVLENQINFYDAEGNGAYAGRITGGHIGNSTSLPVINIDAPNGVVVQVDGNQVANFTKEDLFVNDVAVGAALKNLTDYIKIIEYQTEAVTLDAYGSKAMTIEPETIDGYKYLMSLGGKGNGQTGLIVSSGSAWVFNANNAQKTFKSVSFYLLYIRDI